MSLREAVRSVGAHLAPELSVAEHGCDTVLKCHSHQSSVQELCDESVGVGAIWISEMPCFWPLGMRHESSGV